jgi:hypothetical protein
VNCNLEQQQRGWECWKCTRERGRSKELISGQTFSKQMLKWQESREQVGDKPLPKAGQVADHRAYLLSQWAAPKVKMPHKIEKQWTIITHWQQGGLTEHWPCPRERVWGKEISPQCGNPSKQVHQKTTSKAGQLVGYRTDLLNLRAAFKLKLPHLTGPGADQAAAAEV